MNEATPTPAASWLLQVDGADIAWLRLDVPDSQVNVLSGSVLEELDRHLDDFSSHAPKALIICSSKGAGFIAGADVREFDALHSRAEALEKIRRGQAIMDRLEGLSCPSIALIHGYCLGGGLELALACRYRIAEEDARLGLPEVKLGIHPGFGGSVRLPRVVGPVRALDMILSGRDVPANKAAADGLLDLVVPRRHLFRAARAYALSPPRRRALALRRRLLLATPMRQVLSEISRRRLQRKLSSRHYPAPFAQLDVFAYHGGNAHRMMEAEAQSVADLVTGETARNLIRVFFLRERLKSLGRQADEDPPIQRVHVVGAGAMGGDIAAWCAYKGMTVTLQDLSHDMIAEAVKRSANLCRRKHLRARETTAMMDRLVPDKEGFGVVSADVVIEAVVEKPEVKRSLFAELERLARPDALLATNTSSIPLDTIAGALRDPGRLVGLHFFNPVAMMPLVEVVAGPQSTPQALRRARVFAGLIDRLPLPVRSAPGFLVNRILMPYLLEAMRMASEGVPIDAIDGAATRFGMPVGPLQLADSVGLDICLAVGEVLAGAQGGEVPEALRQMVEQGRLGQKSGQGFYRYPGRGRPQPVQGSASLGLPPVEIQDRLIMGILNEARACLRDGIVEDEDLLDAGMIFGTGFAPFSGGPLYYAGHRHGATVSQRLDELAATYGDRFKPDPGWQGH